METVFLVVCAGEAVAFVLPEWEEDFSSPIVIDLLAHPDAVSSTF